MHAHETTITSNDRAASNTALSRTREIAPFDDLARFYLLWYYLCSSDCCPEPEYCSTERAAGLEHGHATCRGVLPSIKIVHAALATRLQGASLHAFEFAPLTAVYMKALVRMAEATMLYRKRHHFLQHSAASPPCMPPRNMVAGWHTCGCARAVKRCSCIAQLAHHALVSSRADIQA